MPELTPTPRKRALPKKTVIIAVLAAVSAGAFLMEDARLRSNLKSNTRITQSLRDELEALRRQNDSYKEQESKGQTRLDAMGAQLNTLNTGQSMTANRQNDLKRQVEDAEKTLAAQNSKVAQLESKLKEAEEKMARQKKASANLEQQTRSARTNPGMSAEYVKLVESEWMSAMTRTEELNKDLSKTLTELSSHNKERTKLLNDTATMHYNLAVILTDQQNYPAAMIEYRKVLESRPADADAHYNLAILYDDHLKDSQKALEHYREYVRVAPDSPEASKVRRWIQEKEFDTTMKFKL